MSARIGNARVQGLLTGLVSLVLAAALLGPTPSQAQEMKLRPYNNGRGMQSPVRTPQERNDTPEALRLAGTFRYDNRDGLTLQGRTVVVNANTAVFPSLRNRSYLPDPTDLRGRRGTVYGRLGPNGIEAVLVILESKELYSIEIPDLGGDPEATGEARGAVEMPPGTPQ